MFVSPQEVARMLDGFMLGAVMQEDPTLEELGSLPEEPPDDDPCWDMKSTTGKDSPMLEQGTLFDIPEESPKKKRVIHPTQKPNPPMQAVKEEPPSLVLKPYAPRYISYREYLQIFNGDHSLAMHWFNKQPSKA